MRNLKKTVALLVLCLVVGVSTFCTDRNKLPAYAYTDEEKEAAKAWLSENGYPPTREGAEQAYQDYLNGKFGPVGGSDDTSSGTAPSVTEPETGVTDEPAETEPEVEAPQPILITDDNLEVEPEEKKPETVKKTDTNTEKEVAETEEKPDTDTKPALNTETKADVNTKESSDTEKETGIQTEPKEEEIDPDVCTEPEDIDTQATDNKGVNPVIILLIVLVCIVAVFFGIRFMRNRKPRT